MPFVLYATPYFSENALVSLRAVASLSGVRIGLISQEPQELLPPELRARLAGHWKVQDIFDAEQLTAAARSLTARHGSAHRIMGAAEQSQVPIAQTREALGIEGMSVDAILNFRDKSRMKNLFRSAELPCARHCLAEKAEEARTFAAEAGYPLVVKPPDGAGSQSTYRVANEEELEKALKTMPPSPAQKLLLEEFITGEEHSFDTFSLDGEPVFHSLTHYRPTPLEAMREPWIQWQVLLPREVDAPQYDDIRQEAFRALKTLGMKTGMSHMEWFRRQDGSIAISEVAARPPGAQITTLISRAHDFDAEAAWARLVVFGEFGEVPERKYAAGAAFLRGLGKGKVKAVRGVEQVQRELGHLVTDARIPKVGQPSSPSYEGEGFILLRHPETAVVREALARVVSLVRVELE